MSSDKEKAGKNVGTFSSIFLGAGGNPGQEKDLGEQMSATGDYSPYNDKDFSDALNVGVMEDKLNLKFITLWTIAGIISVIVLILIAAQLYSYYSFQRAYDVALTTQPDQITRLQTESRQRLQTVGVIDAEAGRYHIPVDSAFTLILREYNN